MMEHLPFQLSGCQIIGIQHSDDKLTVYARSLTTQATCPVCGCTSMARHGSYIRHPADLACMGQQVRLQLSVQRFRCENTVCSKRTFAESLPTLLLPHARRTSRLTQTLRELAFAVGGEVGARLCRLLGIPVSSSTLIRLIRATILPEPTPATVVGIDDWAKRKGHNYGTILVDLETHRPIDLLPDRDPDTVASWFEAQPQVTIVTRDRGKSYIAGVTQGAPQAEQVADRWHLLKNLSDAVQRQLQGHTQDLRQVAHTLAAASADDTRAQDVATEDQMQADGACETPSAMNPRQVLVDEVKARAARGEGQRHIAREMQMSRQTVVRYIDLDGPLPPRQSVRQPSLVAPYLDILKQRWYVDGCQNVQQLWRELQAQGFLGSSASVWRAVQHFHRTPPTATVEPIRLRTAVYLLIQPTAKLNEAQQKTLQALRDANPLLDKAYGLIQRFAGMVRGEQVEAYDTWLQEAENSGVQYLRTFAAELKTDDAAVRAAMTSSWSNGQTEGQVNRLKTLKRQMYGRAKFDLLRLRVLYQPSFA